ncbi:MAG: hypothetical protein P4N24_14380, partial [Acidobacteriota bacterium]|nr:hypothetical protein [Acidobacteriota bacterium]
MKISEYEAECLKGNKSQSDWYKQRTKFYWDVIDQLTGRLMYSEGITKPHRSSFLFHSSSGDSWAPIQII